METTDSYHHVLSLHRYDVINALTNHSYKPDQKLVDLVDSITDEEMDSLGKALGEAIMDNFWISLKILTEELFEQKEKESNGKQ